MTAILFELLAVAAGAALLHVFLGRLGVQLEAPHLVTIVVLVLLAVISVASLRNQWHRLDEKREETANVPPEAARATCTGVGVDQAFLKFVGSKVRVREPFFLQASASFHGGSALCLRMVLLPRLQVNSLDDARYVIFWDSVPERLLADVKRRGGVVSRYSRRRLVARLP